MSDASGEVSLARLATDLAHSLRDLQRELDDGPGRPRLPTPQELLRFTDEVAIPALILVLETNIRALRLLQRALRFAEGRDTRPTGGSSEVRDRAIALSQTTLDRLDGVLADAQDAIEGQPPDEDSRELLDEARDLRTEIDDRLAAERSDTASAGGTPAETDSDAVPVDVDSELQSLKDDLDDADDS